MCNLYSITTNQAAIAALFRVAMSAISRRCRAHFRTIRLQSFATPPMARTGHDAVGHAPAAKVSMAARHKYPDHDLTALARLAQAGEPLLGPGQQFRRVRAGA
jgi:hypothetical protein